MYVGDNVFHEAELPRVVTEVFITLFNVCTWMLYNEIRHGHLLLNPYHIKFHGHITILFEVRSYLKKRRHC
jgi:hypothetical protein